MYTRFLLTNNFLPLNLISSLSDTLNAGSIITASFTFTFPSLIIVTASLRLQTPQCAKNLFKGINTLLTATGLPDIVLTGAFATGGAYSFLIPTIFSTWLKLLSMAFIFSSFLTWILFAFTALVFGAVAGAWVGAFLAAAFRRLFSSKRLSMAMARSFLAFFFACLNSSLIKLFFFLGTNF